MRESGSIRATPKSTMTMPTGVNEKKVSGCWPALVSTSCITRLGGVPISVSIPPMLLAKARGMSMRPGCAPFCVAMLTTTGIMRAIVPVLLTKPPITAVVNITRRNMKVSFPPASFIRRWLMALANPVWKMAPPTTKRPTIMMTTLDENPANASVGVRMPKIRRAAMAHTATTSERRRPMMNMVTETARITNVVIMS